MENPRSAGLEVGGRGIEPRVSPAVMEHRPAASGSLPGSAPQTGAVRIGSKDFTEELLLAEMYAQLLEANNIPVERKLNLAGTQVAHEALTSNQIDMYPEYTGTAYGFILGNKDNEKDPAKVYKGSADQYKQKWNLDWLEPAPMNDTNAIAGTRLRPTACSYNAKLSRSRATCPLAWVG